MEKNFSFFLFFLIIFLFFHQAKAESEVNFRMKILPLDQENSTKEKQQEKKEKISREKIFSNNNFFSKEKLRCEKEESLIKEKKEERISEDSASLDVWQLINSFEKSFLFRELLNGKSADFLNSSYPFNSITKEQKWLKIFQGNSLKNNYLELITKDNFLFNWFLKLI